jgi:hypothetical protein
MKKGENYSSYNSKKDIPLVLESYNDLFSDFDPRPYSQRALSKDFIEECQKASEDKKNGIELKLLINKKERNNKEEDLIKKRINSHFSKHFLEKKKELLKMRFVGSIWFLVGCFLIVLTTFLDLQNQFFLVKVLIAIAHPGGWFFLWEGLGKIIIHSKEKKGDQVFYKKMNRAKISFLSIK